MNIFMRLVGLDGADKAEEQLLATRPGLQLYRGNSFEDFSCTLAAVPASSEFLQAKAELLELGVTIR